MLRALSIAFSAVAVAVAIPTPSLGQTVADYAETLRVRPILDAPPEVAAGLCRPLLSYVVTSIPPWERAEPFLFGLFAALDYDASLDAKREVCVEVAGQPVVTFDTGSGEQLMKPPALEDPNRPVVFGAPLPQ